MLERDLLITLQHDHTSNGQSDVPVGLWYRLHDPYDIPAAFIIDVDDGTCARQICFHLLDCASALKSGCG